MNKSMVKNKGMAALMLVLWTALALSGLLFDMVSIYGLKLKSIKIEQHRLASRRSAVLCRDMLLIELAENAKFVPVNGFTYKNTVCHFTSFNTSGETKVVRIEGKEGSNIFTIETKIVLSREVGSTPAVVYTKEIEETS